MRRKILLTILLSILPVVFFVSKIYTQNSNNGLSITPFSLELTLEPGQTVTRTITLTNFTDQVADIAVSKRNFTANGEEGQVNLTEEETGFSLASWISTTPQRKTLAPSQKQEFEVTISVPKNAEPGGHFGSVVFGTIPSQNLNQTGALLSQEVAGLILVKIPGDVTERAKIETFAAEKKFYNMGPVDFSIRVKNESTVHIRPEGVVTVTDMFGKKSVVQVEGRNVLPGAIRKLSASHKENFLIGKYTADLKLSYGTQSNSVLTASTTFFAFPVRMGLIGLSILIIVFLLRKRLGKALKTLLTGK
jgi:hypothetical protein